MANIDMKIESKDNSLFGEDIYRNRSILVPRAYQPTISHSTSMNKTGTNANVTIRSDDYVVADVDGRQLMTDRFILATKFTALQSVTAVDERARIFDTHLAMLIALRSYVLDGTLPDNPVVIKALPATLFN